MGNLFLVAAVLASTLASTPAAAERGGLVRGQPIRNAIRILGGGARFNGGMPRFQRQQNGAFGQMNLGRGCRQPGGCGIARGGCGTGGCATGGCATGSCGMGGSCGPNGCGIGAETNGNPEFQSTPQGIQSNGIHSQQQPATPDVTAPEAVVPAPIPIPEQVQRPVADVAPPPVASEQKMLIECGEDKRPLLVSVKGVEVNPVTNIDEQSEWADSLKAKANPSPIEIAWLDRYTKGAVGPKTTNGAASSNFLTSFASIAGFGKPPADAERGEQNWEEACVKAQAEVQKKEFERRQAEAIAQVQAPQQQTVAPQQQPTALPPVTTPQPVAQNVSGQTVTNHAQLLSKLGSAPNEITEGYVLISAKDCGPCQLLKPNWDKFAQATNGKLATLLVQDGNTVHGGESPSDVTSLYRPASYPALYRIYRGPNGEWLREAKQSTNPNLVLSTVVSK